MSNFFNRLRRRGQQNQAERPPEQEENHAFDFASQFPDLAAFLESMNPERLFQRDLAAAMAASLDENQQHEQQTAVAASPSSIRQLPQVRVCRQDFMVNPCNRECAICLEANPVNSHCIRMPCAHFFHRPCVLEWLTSHNTCPVCRYELATDNAEYEVGRLQRMKGRLPRFAQHELDQLSVAQLKALLPETATTVHFTERSEIVQFLVQHRAIEMATVPKKVSYKWSQLSAMSVSNLRKVMNEEANVYFDAAEVVEKKDMLAIFLQSGCLDVLPEDNQYSDTKVEIEQKVHTFSNHQVEPATDTWDETFSLDRKPAAVIVETVTEAGNNAISLDRRLDQNLVMEEDYDYVQSDSPSGADTNTENSRSQHMHAENENNADIANNAMVNEEGGEDAVSVSSNNNGEMECTQGLDTKPLPVELRCCQEEEQSTPHEPSDEHSANAVQDTSSVSSTSSSSRKRQRGEAIGQVRNSSSGNEQEGFPESDHHGAPDIVDIAVEDSSPVLHFDDQSIGQLLSIAEHRSVDLTGCLERREIVERLVSSLSDNDLAYASESATAAPPSTSTQSASSSHHSSENPPLDSWDVSAIRAMATLSGVNLFDCRNRDEMIEKIQKISIKRPKVGKIFDVLAPLTNLSISQLRAVARERQITVSDCLEKGDIIQRIVKETPISDSSC